MKKIGYIPLSTISGKDYMGALEFINTNVQKLNLEQIGLKEIGEFDALVIQDDENQFIEHVCEILVYIKQHSKTLVWFVSERLSRINRTIYPRLGVDGLADKESEPDELALLVSNGLKRTDNGMKIQHKSEQIVLTPNNLSICVAGQNISLTRLEYQMMELLYKNKDKVVTYDEIYEYIWKHKVDNQQYRVSNLIFHLRKKLAACTMDIKTIRSIGYMLDMQ